MSSQNSLTCKVAFWGGSAGEKDSLESISKQLAVPDCRVFSTKELSEYRSFACDYCVLSPAAPSAELVRALVADACSSRYDPQLIILLLGQQTARLEKAFEGMRKPPRIIQTENPDPVRAAELIKSLLILEGSISPPVDGWEFVGASAPVHELYDSIKSYARWDKDPVLITGETGTGKELIARRLHKERIARRLNEIRRGIGHDIRGLRNFRAYNAAAIPLLLSESLLFGHKKGAFTGAEGDREGYIIEAKRGTLFIDEIGEIELALQVKLLRVLQERKVVRLGDEDSKARYTDARFVFATNCNLEEACGEGKFRRDLLHRISVLQIDVKPLRERKPDIPRLVEHFVQEFVNDYKGVAEDIGTDNVLRLDVLFDYDWPGNVRELRNVVRQAAAHTGAGKIDRVLAKLVAEKKRKADAAKSPSPPSISPSPPSSGRAQLQMFGSFANSLLKDYRPIALSRFEQAYDQEICLEAKGDKDRMGILAGVERTTVYKMRRNLKTSFFRAADLKCAAKLTAKLREGGDPLSKYLRDGFEALNRQLLNAYGGGEVSAKLLKALVVELNRRLLDRELYRPELFQHVALTQNTQSLLSQQDVSLTDLFRLNRMLIEDAYPDEIKKSSAAPDDGDRPDEDDDPDEDVG